jgi:hypothetical protein
VPWSPASYERLVGVWELHGNDATRATDWLMTKVVQSIERDHSPPA